MLLRQLTEAFGPSGCEDEVRQLIAVAAKPYAKTMYTDVLGSLYVEMHSAAIGPKVMLCAHMDEVGLMIVHIEDNGLLKFRPVGGIDPRILVSKVVTVGPNRIPGVIGAKAIHLQTPDERKKPLPIDQLYIDIGAKHKEEAEKHVHIGDYAVFATMFKELEEGRFCAKAFDDRVGCSVLLEVMKRCPDIPVTFAFTVQEEIGLRGAGPAAYRIQPDIALVIEGTICFDVIGAPPHGQATILGAGPAISVMDNASMANRSFLRFMKKTAETYQIPHQMRRATGGGNDAGAIHLAREGILTGSLSVPTRYIHAPAQIICREDVEHTVELTAKILDELAKGGNP
ncbi:M42 family metallopeptidase [Fodinisporobacter ferrooxydans]|uniref:M42 family metallopeptidase n=1 Tax=Fodinisporobacter ferrooxydans TaxID=2901836 RepID=A0ABY4CI71_9BACL|nr:M42 family metallopeptidase [Alicyclobacillaceae bacterium MYW30-H2]